MNAKDSMSIPTLKVEPISPINTCESEEFEAKKAKRAPCRRLADKECRICGDRSVGFNFDVVTCESCKAFFRRNARRPLSDFRCAYANDCTITKESRRFCKRCRLVKCFAVGMNKNALPPEDSLYHPSRSLKRKSVDSDNYGEKSARSVLESSVGGLHANSESHNDDSPPSLPSVRQSYENRLKCTCVCALHNPVYYAVQQHRQRQQLEQQPSSSFNTLPSIPLQQQCNPLRFAPEMQSQTTVLLNALAHNTQMNAAPEKPLASDQWPPVFTGSYEQDERHRLQELCTAAHTLLFSFEHDYLTDGGILTGASFLYIMDKVTKRLIECVKQLQPYRVLSSHDQVTLLKGGISEYHILRALINYDIEKEQFQPHARADFYYVRMDGLKDVSWPLYIMLQRFCQTFDPAWAANRPLMLLLIVIKLLNPSRAGLIDPQQVSSMHYSYKALLQRYLANTSANASQAKYTYSALSRKMDELDTINETTLSYLSTVDPNALGQTSAETIISLGAASNNMTDKGSGNGSTST